ncbi:Dps family protein [Arachidicoccus terrestris]|uniref:Dps family protein n=1 Tax=Arachidicoccus terrestris TaxID=2875539 RepID=UPI001CC7A6DC|nr:DNA starvation/stationary phase protection protein [Arachidicoccus terrestris]UAY56379.1 DNA starvation/stationary phase protection protein [Arachidicoccus terrestris]
MKNGKLKAATGEKLKKTKVSTPVEIGITPTHAQAVANKLQQLLADEQILYAKTRNYHWNVEGPNFMEMHLFYERLYNELAEVIDQVAERIRKIGHYAQGRLQDFLKQANLLEGEYTNDQIEQLKNLLSDHETIIRYLRNDIDDFEDKFKDAGSADFITGLLQRHEEWAWFIRSYISNTK